LVVGGIVVFGDFVVIGLIEVNPFVVGGVVVVGK